MTVKRIRHKRAAAGRVIARKIRRHFPGFRIGTWPVKRGLNAKMGCAGSAEPARCRPVNAVNGGGE